MAAHTWTAMIRLLLIMVEIPKPKEHDSTGIAMVWSKQSRPISKRFIRCQNREPVPHSDDITLVYYVSAAQQPGCLIHLHDTLVDQEIRCIGGSRKLTSKQRLVSSHNFITSLPHAWPASDKAERGSLTSKTDNPALIFCLTSNLGDDQVEAAK